MYVFCALQHYVLNIDLPFDIDFKFSHIHSVKLIPEKVCNKRRRFQDLEIGGTHPLQVNDWPIIIYLLPPFHCSEGVLLLGLGLLTTYCSAYLPLAGVGMQLHSSCLEHHW